MKCNYSEAPEFKKRFENLGCKVSFDYKLFPSREGNKDVFTQLINKDQFNFLYKCGIVLPVNEIKCYACCNKIRINQYGDVLPCEYLNLVCGNINNQSILKILKSDNFINIRNAVNGYLPIKCKKCRYKTKCLRCPSLVWNDKPFLNEKNDIMCYLAQFNDL